MKDVLLLLFTGLLSLGLGTPCVQAQPLLSFRHIDSRQGLSQNSVSAIAQDGDGFMWFGTRRGLNRYDGYRMRSYEQASEILDGTSHQEVRSLYYDAAIDRLWVCTNGGLSQYRPEQDDFQPFALPPVADKGQGPPAPRCVLRDAQGHLWVGSSDGLLRFDPASEQFLPCARPARHLAANEAFSVHALYEDDEGLIWVGSSQGVFAMQADAPGQPQYRPRPQDEAVQAMFRADIRFITQDGEGRYWLGAYKRGIFSWQPGEAPVAHRHAPYDPFSLSDDDVRALAVDRQGQLWVGTFLGLNLYDAATGYFHRYAQEIGNPRSLGSGSVRAICFDARGSAWIGTYYEGVSYYNPESYRFTHHQPRGGTQGLSHAVVSSFWEDTKGNLWVGTEGGGINYWDHSRGSYQHERYHSGQQSGLSGNNVKVIAGRGDSLWIGTFASGLNLLHLDTRQWEYFREGPAQPHHLSNDNVYGLWLDGDTLWIATFGGGLNLMDLASGEISVYQHNPNDTSSLCHDQARILLQDRAGHMWIGTNEGLDRIEMTAEGRLRFHHHLPGMMICSLLAARDGSIWVGTFEQGTLVLDETGKVLQHFSRADGLPGQSVFGLLEDRAGRIWLSSEQGLAKIDRRDASITDYNYSDGLDNLEYNLGACYQTQSGEMFFGGTQGFTSFFPQDIRTNTFVPPLAFTHLRTPQGLVRPGDETDLLQVSIDKTEHLVFPYNRANFSLGFAALDYLNPDNNQYAYLLEGLDQKWTRVQGQAEVSYTLQRSGDYLFRVKGGNNDGIWNQGERRIRITVLPPPWRSRTAYTLYGALLLLLLAGGYRFIKLRHRLQLEQLTKSQQEALHQAKLRFYTNVTHEFRTPLTLILGPIEELLREGASAGGERQLQAIQQNAQRLLRLVNQLLSFRSLEQDHSQLQVAAGNIVKFLREVHLSFQEQARLARIDYCFVSEREDIELWFDRDKLEKVCYNLLANAFKFTPQGGTITLALTDDEREVILEVCDSGPGIPTALQARVFERYYHQAGKGEATQEGTGIGLTLAKQLVEMHGGSIELRQGRSQGTCFCVRLPKGKAHLAPEHLLTDFKDSEDVSAYLDKAGSEVQPSSETLALFTREAPKQSLLIVEDNAQVRAYVASIFEPYFALWLAADGQEGLAMAQAQSPDLIISDVMMPNMDGINLCSQLKSRVETSHIPVVLLTARTGQIFRVEGLETGADAYLTKPFSPYELQLKVHNLLTARRRIRERFHSVLKLEPGEITVTSTDQAFLTKAMAIVEAQMDNPDFTVEDFARELAVSRPLLFTKLKAITSQTPNNFVKSLRLKRSAHLLTQSDWGVADIAYQVGFRDARYFSKCFQKEFGETPSAYRARHAED